MENDMTFTKLLAGAAALALLVAAPTASFAQHARSGGGGGMHIGGGGMHVGGGAMRMGGGGMSAGARFAGAPHVGGGGNWAGGQTAWRGGGGGGWHGGHRGGWIPGAVAGAVVGGAIANSYAYYGGPGYYDYGPDYYADNTYYDAGPEVAVVQGGGDPSYCAQRYRSWDPASGTYLGYDGQRHPCP
jgi:hypothetical protein